MSWSPSFCPSRMKKEWVDLKKQKRPQGQINSTHTGYYYVPKPSAILSEGLCHAGSLVSNVSIGSLEYQRERMPNF